MGVLQSKRMQGEGAQVAPYQRHLGTYMSRRGGTCSEGAAAALVGGDTLHCWQGEGRLCLRSGSGTEAARDRKGLALRAAPSGPAGSPAAGGGGGTRHGWLRIG